MSEDKLREQGEKTSLDHMMDLGKAALTVGVGAALFYRGGGKHLLSRGVRISEKVLNDAAGEISRRNLKQLTTKDLKEMYSALIDAPDSSLKKAIEDARSGTIRLRTDDPNNLIGAILQNHVRLMRDKNKLIEKEYTFRKIETPAIEKFTKEYAEDDPLLKTRIRRFISEATNNLNDLVEIENIIERHKLEDSLSRSQIDEMLDFIKERMRRREERSEFFMEYEKTLNQAIDKSLDPDEISRITGSKDKPTARDRFLSKILGDERLAVDDLLENPEKFYGNLVVDHVIGEKEKGQDVVKEAVTFLREIKEKIRIEKGEEKAEAFGKLYVDQFLRKDGDSIYSFAEAATYADRAIESFAGTMPGKILKLRDIRGRYTAPTFYYSRATGNIADPILARLTNEQSKDSLIPEKSFLRIYGRSYEFRSGELIHEEALDDTYLTYRYGTVPRLINHISGNVDYRIKGSRLGELFDIGQEGVPTLLDDAKSIFKKFGDEKWSGNVIDSFLNESGEMKAFLDQLKQSEEVTEEARKQVVDIIRKAKILDEFYSKNTYELNREAVHKLMDKAKGETRRLLEILSLNDEDMLQAILLKDSSSIRDFTKYHNQGLISLLGSYIRDPKRTRDIISQKSSRENFFGGKETARFFDMLRMEIAKEAFMTHAIENSSPTKPKYNFDAISDLIESAGLSEKTKRETKRLADWAVLQQATGISKKTSINTDVKGLIDSAENLLEVFLEPKDKTQLNAKYFKELRENLHQMKADRLAKFEQSYQSFLDNTDIATADMQDEWIHVRKMISPLDIIKDLNDTEKAKAFFKQFYAGRENLENVTTATLAPYFMLIRLSDALSKIGLSFSVRSTGSVGELAKNIFLRRGLPLVVGITYYDYLSDMTKVLTGTSLTGAFASGLANVDLAFRRFTDATGLTEFLKTEKEINPLLSYWTGDEYMSYEERKEWYETGYSEMRKARWWNFGSINEWRGPEIQYFQPNYLRRAHSDWKDAALYDSVWEKWSRSWLPTPTAPWSPIRYLMNPYWLEEKHAEDRPYMMTGKMFTEQTLWGPILNPTIGELIKPQKMMHQDRLDKNFVDVKALIEEHNRAQFEKAKDKEERHLIRLKEGVIEPVIYTTLDAPTPSERILSLSIKEGEVADVSVSSYQDFSGVLPVESYIEGSFDNTGINAEAGIFVSGAGLASARGNMGVGTIEGLSFRDKIELGAEKGDILPSIVHQFISRFRPMEEISDINRGIFEKAIVRASQPDEPGVVTPESIYRREARYGSYVLQNKEALADLRGLSSGDAFLREMAYASRFAAGIYGYGTFRLFPGQPGFEVEDASKIYSPIRTFWDINIGGLGGGYVEIFRRFIPAFDHKVEEFNPLLNTMPDWLPERFRFGDPYTKIPKGEMRLPGKGYESLNELHPDRFGQYGAFDRFKILADIAPYSHEYKVWRDIASKTVTDPELREEMRKIRERVAEQSKKYDFYPYKFLGKRTERETVIIEEVMNNNYFRIVGDDRVYRLAGIEVSGQKGNVLGQYLVPGMEVVMVTDKNQYEGTNEDSYQSINASIFIQGENLNRQLLKEGLARRRENDYSAAAAIGLYSDFEIARGAFWEAISHAPIPYFQQKYFKIRDPLESYKHEIVYGTSYASWTFPIKSFLLPAIERSLMSDVEMAIGVGSFLMNQAVYKHSSSRLAKNLSNAALMLTNRGAFIGGFIGLAVYGRGNAARRLAQIGALSQMAMWLYTRSDQPAEATIGFGALGAAVGHVLKDVGKLKGGAVGAAIGLMLSAQQTSLFEEDLNKEWIPERTLKRWEMQEYFDRIEYIKYSGLFEKAARKAYLLEGTDVKKLIHQYEKSKEENEKLRQELEEQKRTVEQVYAPGDPRREKLIEEIDRKIKAIEETEILLTAGKWTRAALIYKQAMDSTIYGLQEDASWAQLLRSIPSNERDHFIEFAKVKDPKRREEILKYVSPYQRRALQIAWGEEPDEPESMASFFRRHKLPDPTWSGWRPNVDLKNIEVKTIYNEGMLLSDFGHYESQLRDPEVVHAEHINPNEPTGPMELRMNLIAALKGLGLTGVDVSIEPSTKNSVEVAVDILRIAEYNIKQKMKDMLSL